MSREIIVKKRDDLDPSLDADETLQFTFEGFIYSVDLAEKNAQAFREFIQPYMLAAFEKVKVPKQQAQPAGAASDGRAATGLPPEVRDSVRSWAKRNKLDMGTKIVSYEVREAYYDATGDEGVLTPGFIKWREKKEREEIRVWAKSNGLAVGGSIIPAPTVEAFHKAHGGSEQEDTPEAQGRLELSGTLTPGRRPRTERSFQKKGGDTARSLAIPDPQLRDAIREWARNNGYDMGKGFIKREIQDAYAAAQTNGAQQ